MTLTEKQLTTIPKLKTELAYSKVEHLLSIYYENQLKKEVSQIFHEIKQEVIRNLTEHYDSNVMFQAHMDLILAPIHEHHKQYYETLLKYKIREFDKSRASGKRIVERTINFTRKGNVINHQFTVLKSDINDIVSSTISKDKLFGTSEIAHNNLASRTYKLSEKTLSRVDTDINDIITKGYEEGWGSKKVGHDINNRFNQLETWESARIARTEIHNSHSLGLIQGYDDMGVEYIEWSAANDTRTRDTHMHLDGEIIPMGGLFSNGLRYPGDMNGSAKEVINCRCSALPFIMPYGYIAPPGMAQFREDDLITTLDYWNQDELITQLQEEISAIPKQSSSFDLNIINPKLINSKFSIPNENLSDFGISEKGMETIQRYTKRRSGSDIEYGVIFNEKTGKFLTKEFHGNNNDILMLKPNGKYSTIHYHTDEGFRPTSSGDFSEFLKSKNERVGINISRKESWFIKNEDKFSLEEINKITEDIAKLEEKQLKKLNKEYYQELNKIKKIKDPVKRQSAQKEFEKRVSNEFLDKHNKELGDAILEYTSNIKGLKVKRVIHTETNPKTIKTISKKELKVDKRTYEEIGINRYSTPIKNTEPNLPPRVALRKEVMASEKDLFSLTKDEKQFLNSLEQKQRNGLYLEESEHNALIHFKEKEDYNEMRTQIINRSAMTNENFDWDYFEELHEKFKDWTPLKPLSEIKKIKVEIPQPKKIFENPDLVELTPYEKDLLKNIQSNVVFIYNGGMDRKVSRYYKIIKKDLKAKKRLAELHKRASSEYYSDILNERESKEYVNLYLKYQEKWNLPNIDLNANVHVPDKRIEDTFQIDNNFSISDRFKLTYDENKLLNKLMKHKFLRGGNVSAKNEKAIQLLKDQRDFNDLYSLRLTKKGLSYKEDKLYRELAERLTKNGYDVLATTKIPELNIFKELHVIHKNELKLKEGAKRYKRIKGLTYDGSIPQGLEIDDLFTYDVRNLSPFEKEIYDGWLSNSYRNYRAYFAKCKRNKKCYEEWKQTEHKGTNISAEELEYNWPIIQNVNKNQLKKNMRLFRRQRNHHLADDKSSGIPEVGDCVTFHGFNSTAITEKGADYYAKTVVHGADDWENQFKWLIEIEAPTGTQGAYIAPISIDKFKPEMEFLLQEETKTIIKEFDKDNHHAVVQIVKECPKRK